MSKDQEAVPRRSRWKRILGYAVALLLAAAFFAYLQAPGYIQSEAVKRLRAMGFPEASVDGVVLKTDRVLLYGVALDANKTVRAGAVEIRLGKNLRQGRADTLILRDVQLPLAVTGGKLDLGLLAQWKPAEGTVPLDNAVVENLQLLLNWEGSLLPVPSQAEIVFNPNGSITLDGQARFGGGSLEAAANWDGLALSGTLKLLPPPGGVEVPWKGQLWSVRSKAVTLAGTLLKQSLEARVTIQELSLAGQAGKAAVENLSASIPVCWNGAKRSLTEEDHFSIDRLTVGSQVCRDLRGQVGLHNRSIAARFRLPVAVNSGPRLLVPLAGEVALGQDGAAHVQFHWDGSARYEGAGTILPGESIALKVGGHELSIRSKSFDFSGVWAREALGAKVSIGGLTVTDDTTDVKVLNLRGVIPVFYNDALSSPGAENRLDIEAVVVGGQSYNDLSGNVSVRDLEVTALFEVAFLKEARLWLTAGFDLAHPGLAGRLAVNSNRFEVTDPDALAERIPELKGFAVKGGMSLAGEVAWNGQSLIPNYTLTLEDVSLASRRMEVDATGINGVVRLKRPGAVEAVPSHITVRHLKVGELDLEKGVVRCHSVSHQLFEAGNFFLTMHIAKAGFDWAGGSIGCNRLDYDYGKGRVDLRLVLEKIGFAQLCDLFAPGRLRGEGAISGFWDLAVLWNARGSLRDASKSVSLEFGQGRLEARDKGWLALLSREDMDRIVKKLPEQIQPQAEAALRDFAYEKLTVNSMGTTRNLSQARVFARGYGPRKSKDPIPFGGVTVNVSGLDGLLESRIFRNRGVDQTAPESDGNTAKPAVPDKKDPAKIDDADLRAIDMFF